MDDHLRPPLMSDDDAADRAARRVHHHLIAAPHSKSEGPIAAAEATADGLTSPDHPLGPLGAPLDRRSAFVRGAAATAGVVVILALAELIYLARDEIVLMGLALFIALGIEPVVSWLVVHRWPRWLGITAVTALGIAAVAAFADLVGPVLAAQTAQAPAYLEAVQNQHTLIGRLNARVGLQQYLDSHVLLTAGRAVFGALGSAVVVVVLALYFVADAPASGAPCTGSSRPPDPGRSSSPTRSRGGSGGYVLGNVVVSVIAGLLSLVVLLLLRVPYPFLLATVVALLDLIPVVDPSPPASSSAWSRSPCPRRRGGP